MMVEEKLLAQLKISPPYQGTRKWHMNTSAFTPSSIASHAPESKLNNEENFPCDGVSLR